MICYCADDGAIFTSKIRAIEYGAAKSQRIRLSYHDATYRKLDWKTEPPYSLAHYYLEQAKRIRDEYDYVVLFFSGGYDSSNILETFHFNGLKIDKIVTVGAFSRDSSSGVDENHNGEIYHNVFPYLKELGLESITQVVDYTDYFTDPRKLSISACGAEWADETGAWFSPHHWFWRDIEQHVVPAGMENKKVALVFGRDKPWLRKIGYRLGFAFNDAAVMGYGPPNGSMNCDRINFYWDPEAPEILIKQLHVLKRMGEVNKASNAVYTLRRPIVFKSPKSTSVFLSLRDQYMIRSKDSEAFKLYAAGIKQIEARVGLSNVRNLLSNIYMID